MNFCTKSPGCPSLPGRAPARLAAAMRCSAPPPCPADIRPPVSPRDGLKARVGKGRRWRPFHPPRPTRPGAAAPAFLPGPALPVSRGPVSRSHPRRGAGGGLGLELANALRYRPRLPRCLLEVWGGGFPRSPSTYRGRRRRGGRRGFRLGRAALAGPAQAVSLQSRSGNRSAGNRSAGSGSAPARTRGGAAGPRNYRKASTRGGGKHSCPRCHRALDSLAQASSWDAGNSCSLGVRPAGGVSGEK